MKKIRNAKERGFTLIEGLAAIFVLTVGAGAASILITKTTSLTSVISSRLTAFYLGQEGIETIRNIRDTNQLAGNNWDANIGKTSSYELDYRSSKFPDDVNCSGKDYLKFNPVDGYYECSSAPDSNHLQREITVIPDDPSNPTILKVSVKVIWKERGHTHTIGVKENLYKR